MDRDAFNELLASVDIQDWLDEQGVDYRKGAPGQLLLKDCPWCGRSKWKVSMRADDGRGRCYSSECAQGFNIFSFARQHLQTDTRGTYAHFEMFTRGAPQKPQEAPKGSPAVITPLDWKLPSSTPLPLPSGQNHPMLDARKITPSTTALFQLRYCHDGVYRCVDFDGRPRQTDFSRRILIPVFDLDGELKTFQARDTTGEAEKRYLFPMLLPGSGRFLFGGNLVRGKAHLVLGEGPFDVMAIHQAIAGQVGFRDTGAAGTFGLSLGHGHETGDDQLGRIRQLRQEGLVRVTFLWDAEPGALKQALIAGQMLRAEGLKVGIGLLPAGKDPNEVDTQCVRDAISDATPLTDAIMTQWKLRSPL